MDERTKLNLCRICLESGAKLPLFENNQDENCNIQSKLSICLKEKIEDIDGYPRFICQPCKDILDETYNFIIKYKDTCRILENGLHILKEESIEYNFSDHEQSEEEIDIKDIKNELKSSNETDLGDQNEETFEPVQLNINLKLEQKKPTKKLKYKRICGTNTRQLTSKVASSILEGEFAWNGDKWCLNTEKTNNKIKEKIKSLIYTTQKGKQIRIRIPRKKIPNPPKLCDLCGKVFNTADRLSYHKRSVHFPKPVKCSLCPKMLSSDYYLARHMKRSHNGEKKFMCSICGRGFVFKGELSSHDRNVHKKHLKLRKDYKCQFCDKIYKCAKSVLVHERSAHTGQRPAVCTVCGSSFFHEDYLKEHMRLHTGETPFKCPICGRGYAQRGNMKSHLRIHRISELDASTLSKLRPNYLRLLKA